MKSLVKPVVRRLVRQPDDRCSSHMFGGKCIRCLMRLDVRCYYDGIDRWVRSCNDKRLHWSCFQQVALPENEGSSELKVRKNIRKCKNCPLRLNRQKACHFFSRRSLHLICQSAIRSMGAAFPEIHCRISVFTGSFYLSDWELLQSECLNLVRISIRRSSRALLITTFALYSRVLRFEVQLRGFGPKFLAYMYNL